MSDFFEELSAIARRKLKASDGFEVFYVQTIGNTRDLLVKGAVPRLLMNGKRKGEKTWRGCKPVLQCCITAEEIHRHQREASANSGMNALSDS